MRILGINESSPYDQLIGVGGIGTGLFFALEANHTLGREESRSGRLLDVRDYCKLHIISHYVAKLLGAGKSGSAFRVVPIGLVGNDPPGRLLLNEMSDAGIDTKLVRTIDGAPTLFSVCFQFPNGEGGNITASNSAAAALTEGDVENATATIASTGKRTITLAVPEAPLSARRRLLEWASRAGAFRAASFVTSEIQPCRESGILDMLDLVAFNEEESAVFVGCRFTPEEPRHFIQACLRFLSSCYPRLQMIVTVGKHGAYAFANDRYIHCPAPSVQVASTAGAGDSLLAGVLAALAAGIPLLCDGSQRAPSADRYLKSALDFGVLLASYKCSSRHTIHPDASLDELVEFAIRLGMMFSPRFEQLFLERAT